MRMILTRSCYAMTVGLAMLGGGCSGNGTTSTGGAGGSSGATSESGGLVGSGGLRSGSGGIAGTGGIGAGTGGQNASGGGLATGGAVATGGSVSATGGQLGTGGTAETGGRVGSGGDSATGGRTGSGGSGPTGGAAVGGTGAATGGRSSTGTTGIAGSSATGGSNPNGGTSAALPSPGCGKASTLTFGTVPGENATATPGGPDQGTGKGGWVTITSGGQSRGFALRLPDNYDNTKPYWLIFGFHGNGMTASSVDSGGANGYMTAYWGLQRESKNGAFFVSPEWSGGGWGTGDLAFTDDMVKTISNNYCIDMSNIVASGFSYGGGMTHTLACNRANTNTNSVGYKFRAAVMFEACSFLVQGSCPNRDPIQIWQMAGLTDGVCTFDDSKTVRNWFTDRDGCTGWTSETGNVAASKTGTTSQEPTQPPMPGSYINPGGHVCSNYTCSNGAVRWCANQSGHGTAVVDGTSSLYDECANVTSQYPHGNCSPGCPCTWTPDDIWRWLNNPSANTYTPNITAF